MLSNILNINPAHASIASISAALTGEVTQILSRASLVDTGFQHLAWSVAILAGIVSIVNGTRKWFRHKP